MLIREWTTATPTPHVVRLEHRADDNELAISVDGADVYWCPAEVRGNHHFVHEFSIDGVGYSLIGFQSPFDSSFEFSPTQVRSSALHRLAQRRHILLALLFLTSTGLLLAGVALCVAASCGRRGETVATLIDAQGTVERNDGAQAWTAAAPGFAFVVGDILKTSAHAQARLRLTNGTVIRVLENARIRFARGTLPSTKGANVNVELGSAEVESATAEVALVTALGVARIERGARVRVSSDGGRAAPDHHHAAHRRAQLRHQRDGGLLRGPERPGPGADRGRVPGLHPEDRLQARGERVAGLSSGARI